MADKDLNALFLDTLKDIYYAEKQIYKALPKMAKAAQSDELKAAFEKHLKQTEGHVSRLEQVFELIEVQPRGKKCEAIEGIIEEGAEKAVAGERDKLVPRQVERIGDGGVIGVHIAAEIAGVVAVHGGELPVRADRLCAGLPGGVCRRRVGADLGREPRLAAPGYGGNW